MQGSPDRSGPLVSCLCVTEGRTAFMPWLLWNYDRQRWPRRELVVIDSSPRPVQVPDRPDIRVVAAPPGTGVTAKRNQALAEANGEIIAWVDDDDWQHPDRLAVLVDAMAGGAVYAWPRRAWFVDLLGRRCAPYVGRKRRVVFNGSGFRTAAVRTIPFPPHLPVTSDTLWVAAVAAAYPEGGLLLDRQELVLWLCHAANVSNPVHRHSFTEPLEHVRDIVGAAAWGDTDAALDALVARLAPEAAEVGPWRGPEVDPKFVELRWRPDDFRLR